MTPENICMKYYKHKGVVAFGISFERWTEAKGVDSGRDYLLRDRLAVRVDLWSWSISFHPRPSGWRMEPKRFQDETKPRSILKNMPEL